MSNAASVPKTDISSKKQAFLQVSRCAGHENKRHPCSQSVYNLAKGIFVQETLNKEEFHLSHPRASLPGNEGTRKDHELGIPALWFINYFHIFLNSDVQQPYKAGVPQVRK